MLHPETIQASLLLRTLLEKSRPTSIWGCSVNSYSINYFMRTMRFVAVKSSAVILQKYTPLDISEASQVTV